MASRRDVKERSRFPCFAVDSRRGSMVRLAENRVRNLVAQRDGSIRRLGRVGRGEDKCHLALQVADADEGINPGVAENGGGGLVCEAEPLVTPVGRAVTAQAAATDGSCAGAFPAASAAAISFSNCTVCIS